MMKRYRFTIFFEDIWQAPFKVNNVVQDIEVSEHSEAHSRAREMAQIGITFRTVDDTTYVPGHRITHIDMRLKRG